MNERNIWQMRQNKPTYVVRDILKRYPMLDKDFMYSILLKRGIFKWLTVRRELIRLKDKWKKELTELYNTKPHDKGYIKALEKCRKEIRELCHSERWVAPDNDKESIRWLDQRTRLGG